MFKNVIEELYIAIESTALVLGWIIQTSYFLLEILLEKPWITQYLQWKQMDHRWINWVCIKFAKLILKLSNWFWSQVIVEISFINLWHGMSNVTIEIIFQPKSIQKKLYVHIFKNKYLQWYPRYKYMELHFLPTLEHCEGFLLVITKNADAVCYFLKFCAIVIYSVFCQKVECHIKWCHLWYLLHCIMEHFWFNPY